MDTSRAWRNGKHDIGGSAHSKVGEKTNVRKARPKSPLGGVLFLASEKSPAEAGLIISRTLLGFAVARQHRQTHRYNYDKWLHSARETRGSSPERDFGQLVARTERPTAEPVARFELPAVRFLDENYLCVVPKAQALFCRRRHQPRRPPFTGKMPDCLVNRHPRHFPSTAPRAQAPSPRSAPPYGRETANRGLLPGICGRSAAPFPC